MQLQNLSLDRSREKKKFRFRPNWGRPWQVRREDTVLENQLRGRYGRVQSCLFAPLTLLEIWTKHLCRKGYGRLLSREGFNFTVVHLERCFLVWCIGEEIQIIPRMPSSGFRNQRVPWSNGEQRQMVHRMLSSYPFDSHYQASNNVIVMGRGIDLFCNQIISDCKTNLLTASNGFISAPNTPPPSPPNFVILKVLLLWITNFRCTCYIQVAAWDAAPS